MLRRPLGVLRQACISAAIEAAPRVYFGTRVSSDLVALRLTAQLPPHNVLIVGDGNFSYSKALTNSFQRDGIPPSSIIATSLDSHDDIEYMYPSAAASLSFLRAAGVRVLHQVNATALANYKTAFNVHAGFDRIVFNFPHFADGGNTRNKISKHREFLKEFFMSCQSVLAPGGQIWLSLCEGQGGTPADTLQRNEGDTWQVVSCAAAGAMLLLDVVPFPYAELSSLGYNSVGYRLQDRAFRSEFGLIHIFGQESPIAGNRSRFAQTWSRHVSFWRGPRYSLEAVVAAFQGVFGPGVVIGLKQQDEYHCKKTNRTSFMFNVTFESRVHNFSRHRLTDLIQVVAQRLADEDVGQVRS
ncbi:hypothetical protein H310_06415 [Aphanomyces invadans]|uniref:25S rRNA (uridine-N(3))-methyltransferase BMT5-like domain-containing protein n=1 Tax=Aphanomyces invadans TaxID=157072 RepID=A0A024U6F1_9STRA|nr:hypothetical protein H310_06415 [Aphanomyces invadans]ETW01844.1 hypothetical protein H310_06415 [Aphanomyces invadans]|eukprot:XP_008869692.1 hypothetical protein H310_06415 [Aphanomyces invadans]